MEDFEGQSDEAVACRVQNGDLEAFGALIERYEAKLLRYARRFLRDREESRDLVQDVFLRAYTNIQSFDINRKFSSWIYRIAHNTFINALRKNRFNLTTLDPDTIFPHPVSPESPISDVEKKDLKKVLDESLSGLDSKYREPLILYFYEDMDYKEIAEVLEIPVSTVGIRLKRGKEALQKKLNHQKP